MNYNNKIKTFYNEFMSVKSKVGFSRSPEKPALLIKYLKENKLLDKYFEMVYAFPPFEREDFLIAHSPNFVDAFLSGIPPLCNSNGLSWSEDFARSVTYTNSSLYYAIKSAVKDPHQITFSPTSGFHHARPSSGSAFCTFSGQVIASVKIYREQGLRGAWLDLDQHFGNSIGDSRGFVKDLYYAIPPRFNINPESSGYEYIESLQKQLRMLEIAVVNEEIDYVVWAHGADSHEDDDLGGKVNTKQWIECATIFFTWLKNLNEKRGKPLPLAITLFGGYREENYNAVLSLHTADLVECLNIILGHKISFTLELED